MTSNPAANGTFTLPLLIRRRLPLLRTQRVNAGADGATHREAYDASSDNDGAAEGLR
jgi:hypothetical protein